MNAEHRHELEQNSLIRLANRTIERLKNGDFINRKVGVGLLIIAAILGYRWYALDKSQKADSKMWALFDRIMTPEDWGKFAEGNSGTIAARLARLEIARSQLGPEGLSNLQTHDRDKRKKGIENITTARDEFLKLADEFRDDPSLRSTCLMSAAEAELALVGIPGSGSESRGSVAKVAEYYQKVAKSVGEKSTLGEKLTKRAADMLEDKKRKEIEETGRKLNEMLMPPPSLSFPEEPKSPSKETKPRMFEEIIAPTIGTTAPPTIGTVPPPIVPNPIVPTIPQVPPIGTTGK